jgi:hypothetical protein
LNLQAARKCFCQSSQFTQPDHFLVRNVSNRYLFHIQSGKCGMNSIQSTIMIISSMKSISSIIMIISSMNSISSIIMIIKKAFRQFKDRQPCQ